MAVKDVDIKVYDATGAEDAAASCTIERKTINDVAYLKVTSNDGTNTVVSYLLYNDITTANTALS